jgi:hypothetical protein
MGNRGASTILSETAASGAKNDLNGSALAEYFDHNLSDGSLHANLTVPTSKSVRVYVEQMNGAGPITARDADGTPVRLVAGDRYDNQSATTVTRIVTMDDSPVCNVGCRLVVRIW